MKPGQQRSPTESSREVRDGDRRLVAIAYTDVVGYSGVVHRDEALGEKMLERQSAIVRAVLPLFGGREVRLTGDGFLLEFGSALSAVKALAVIQTRIATDEQAASCPVTLRTSVHLGDVDYVAGDVYGDGVIVAASLLPLSPQGGIAMSETVRMQVRQRLDLPLRSIGTPALKNIGAPIEVFVAEAPDLHALGAPLSTAAAAKSVEAEALPAPDPRRRRVGPAAMLGGAVVLAFAVALVAWFGLRPALRPAGALDKSIAVLPFANMSSDKEQEYFSDGIAEDLLNLLTKVPSLQVAARTSSFSFKGRNVPIAEIGAALHVSHVLEGSVRKGGNAVRINTQLVRAADGYQVWSQSWDRQIDDVFKIQDEIANAVVEQLKIRLLGDAPTARPVDPRVYPLVLQAESLMYQFTPKALVQAIATYEKALAIAPDEPRAWAGLARSRVNQVVVSGMEPVEAARRIREAANKALELDPANVTALASLGYVASHFDDDLAAEAHYYERASAIEPGNAMILNAIGNALQTTGRPDQARPLFEYRVAHDPANASAYANLGNCEYYARRWERAIEANRTALRLAPDLQTLRFTIGAAMLLGRGDATGALAEFDAEPDESGRLTGKAMALHARGRAAEADAALRELVEKYGADQPETVAMAYAYRGEKDAAFEWLGKAADIRDPYLNTVFAEPLFGSLHDDPRWLPYLRRIGYAPEQLAKIQLKVTQPGAAGPATR